MERIRVVEAWSVEALESKVSILLQNSPGWEIKDTALNVCVSATDPDMRTYSLVLTLKNKDDRNE